MLKYLLRRILFFIPTLIIISLLAFIISVNAPGDPVSRLMATSESGDMLRGKSETQLLQQKMWTHRLGLDLPIFYFSVTPSSFPDTLYKIYDRTERDAVKSLLTQFGNRNSAMAFHQSLKNISAQLEHPSTNEEELSHYTKNEITDATNRSRYLCSLLLRSSSIDY